MKARASTPPPPRWRLRYRAAGPEVVERLGRDIAGLFLDELMTGSSLSVLTALYDLTATARAAVYSRTTMTTPAKAGEMIAHRLMLPISNDRQRVDMILAAQTIETAPGVQADFAVGTQNRMEWTAMPALTRAKLRRPGRPTIT